jgi:glycosyltransferase involved in cell wall biosynthesis
MITLNCADDIGVALGSILPLADEMCIADTGSTDNTKDVIREACEAFPDVELKLIDFEPEERHPEHGWICDFAAARNAALALCTGDLVMWLDADDVIDNSDKFSECMEDWMYSGRSNWLRALYKYQFIVDMCIDALPRERVWARGAAEWVYPVHEVARPLRPLHLHDASGQPDAPPKWWVRHRQKRENVPMSAARNLWIMERYEAKGGQMNSRMYWNLADALRSCGRVDEALASYSQGLRCHPNDEERYIMTMRLGDCLRLQGKADEAMEYYALTTAIMPHRKEAFLRLAEHCADLGMSQEAMTWCDVADAVVENPLLVEQFNPTEQLVAPNYTRGRVMKEAGRMREAGEFLLKIERQMPGVPQVTRLLGEIQGILIKEQLGKSFDNILQAVVGPERRAALLSLAPEPLRDLPEVARFHRPQRPDDKLTVAFLCGVSHKPWGPEDLETGLGGSEEAVVFLSRELAAAGAHVEVYCYPHTTGVDEYGVGWYRWDTWSADEEMDVAIIWRNPQLVKSTLTAATSGCKQRFMWLHDVVVPEWYTEELCEMLDGIFVLSRFHAKPLPECAKSLEIQTTNGLDPEFFVDEGKHDPTQLLYCSSPDRGIEQLLEMWPEIRKAHPDAVLHHYYGFTKTYDVAMARNPELRRLRGKVTALLKQEGVVDHGWVGHKELAQAMADCGIWVYPTSWPETSCITSMKAQAMGCLPVTSRFIDSGVPETTKYDLGPDPEPGAIKDNPEWQGRWCERLIEVIHNAKDGQYDEMREQMMGWARKTYSWKLVAKQWMEVFSGTASAVEPSAEALADSPTPGGG